VIKIAKLALNPEFNLYELKGQALCGSRQIAEEFEKRHSDVLRDIEVGIKNLNNAGERKFAETNFTFTTYRDSQNKKQPEVLMAKDGFVYITMGYSGQKATRFKVAYIHRYNNMEAFIKSLLATKIEFPAFTDAIMAAHEEPKHYHFSNEINMIYRIVLGMDAKKFREAHGIEKGAVIKPHLKLNQIKAVETLQRVDIGLILAIPEFQQRKTVLESHYRKTVLPKYEPIGVSA